MGHLVRQLAESSEETEGSIASPNAYINLHHSPQQVGMVWPLALMSIKSYPVNSS